MKRLFLTCWFATMATGAFAQTCVPAFRLVPLDDDVHTMLHHPGCFQVLVGLVNEPSNG